MTHARRSLVLLPLGALALFLPSRALAGDEAPAADDSTRAVAAALENENLRMRAKIESAALLAKAGRPDEAIEALRAVEDVRTEGKALVERLLKSRATFRITLTPQGVPPPEAPLPTGGSRPRVRWYPPDRTGPDPDLPGLKSPEDSAREEVGHRVSAGIGALLAARGADRFWRAAAAGDGPADLVTTGMAILALLDVSDATQSVASLEWATRWETAALESLTALVAVHDAKTGRFLPDASPEAHAVATWALAAGLTRFEDASWREPLQKAVARALADRNAKGLWPSASGTPDDDWVLAGFEVAMLHEASHHASLVAGLGVDAAIDRAGSLAFADQISATPLSTAAGAYARACLARRARRALGLADGPLLPTDAQRVVLELPSAASGTDATGLLFATALRVGGDAADLEAWQRRVLTPLLLQDLRQKGTWTGGDARSQTHGPAYASACVLLAWFAPTSQLRFPKSP